jgi:outer membrane receptor protein involved in Fe transport
MRKVLPRIIVLFFLVVYALSAYSQEKFTARIVDSSDRVSLIGATVIAVNQNNINAITDNDGIFLLQNVSFPLTISITYIGYKTKTLSYNEKPKAPPTIYLSGDAQLLESVLIKGQRVSEKQKADPKSVESMDILAIKETPSISFYNGLGNLKGVDLTTASLGFTIINTRGFNSTSPVRSLQLIDGVDNQAPGLNFSLGNFLGVSELDILKVDIVSGASSTLYGPNAFNGVIDMETKNPFYHQGLGVSLKFGERNLAEAAIRWGDAIKNRNNQDVFAYKFNLFHLRAHDWEADNQNAVYGSKLPQSNLGGYDAVNVYGDEYRSLFYNGQQIAYHGLESWSRRGYKETELVDYNTRNTKANLGFYFKTQPRKGIESPEIILTSNFGAGTTVYQGENRFSLKNILFFQDKLEFSKKGKYFIRVYATNENAGKSYDPYFTALQLQKEAKTDIDYYNSVLRYWTRNINPRAKANEYNPFIKDSVLVGGVWYPFNRFDQGLYDSWKAGHLDSLKAWYDEARAYGDTSTSKFSVEQPFYEPGTARFQQKFNKIISQSSNDRGSKIGSRFFDKSALYHFQAERIFDTHAGKITVGGSGRLFRPNSNGTIFYDTAGIKIKTYEFGLYSGIEKKIFRDKLTLNAAVRADKNKNFNWLFSPAASIVYNPIENNYFRLSYSSAIRNPTLADQYLFLNVGPATLVGNLHGADSVITLESFVNYLDYQKKDSLRYFSINKIRPEQVNTFEIGARTTLFESVYVDASYYFNIYRHFIGYQIGIKSDFDSITGIPQNTEVYRYSANSENRVTTQGFNIGLNYYFATYFMLAGNYSWNKLNKDFPDDPIIPAFNTPENKYNISISARDLSIKLGTRQIKNIGFNVTYKWIEGFIFEGSPQFTGYIPSYGLVDAQISFGLRKINTEMKIGAANLLNNKVYQTYGGPLVGRLAYINFVFNLKTQ